MLKLRRRPLTVAYAFIGFANQSETGQYRIGIDPFLYFHTSIIEKARRLTMCVVTQDRVRSYGISLRSGRPPSVCAVFPGRRRGREEREAPSFSRAGADPSDYRRERLAVHRQQAADLTDTRRAGHNNAPNGARPIRGE